MSESKQSVAKRKRIRRVVGLIVVLTLIALVVRQYWPGGAESEAAAADALKASGIIQAEEVSVASEFGGRIVEIQVAEGDDVAAGDLLVRLDTALLDAQIEAVEAAVALTEAGLAQAKAGARRG